MGVGMVVTNLKEPATLTWKVSWTSNLFWPAATPGSVSHPQKAKEMKGTWWG